MDRYWVGGTANWDATAGTKWAASSGGAGGETVPTTADDVYFDAASGAVTVTLGASGACANLNFTGFTGTLTGSFGLVISQSLILEPSAGFTTSGTVTFSTSSVATITTNGKVINTPLSFNKNTGSISLNDALNISNATLTITSGTFTTNNFNVTATSLSSSNSNVRTINLGSSTVTLSQTGGNAVNFSTSTNLTFNSGTSTIVYTGAANLNGGGGQTFYNLSLTRTSGSYTAQIFGLNTFNNLTVTAPAAAGVTQVTFDSRQTIDGTLSTTGTAGNRRVWFRGTTYGLTQTLTINSAPSLTDADFRDIYVIGTAAPISGTRIGDLRGIRGITASTPKTVFWNLAAGGNWSANAWAASSGGGVSTDNFPLAQDTATFVNTGLNTSATVTFDAAIAYTGTVDMSGRTNAMTLSVSNGYFIYGDWKNGSGTTLSGAGSPLFHGRNTQTITSAGKVFSGGMQIDSYGGAVELADALNIGSNSLIVTNGTFDTKNYNVTAGSLSSNNSNVRTITLGSSTVTLSFSNSVVFTTSINLTLNAGTSTLQLSGNNNVFDGGGLSFSSVVFTGSGITITAANTFTNLTFTALSSAGLRQCEFATNNTINGTLTCAGATAVRRIFLRSSVLGTPRTLTVNSLSATDCDFRDITIAGAAAGSSPTRAGDCGGNTGITFPAAKTVYWNLAGSQNWSATAWASGSGGTPDINNFPLAQDTAVFDDAGSAGTVSINATFAVGTLQMVARTSAMTLSVGSSGTFVYGDVLFGVGVTNASVNNNWTFSGRGTQTITSAGVAFGTAVTIDCFTGTVQLADALTINSARTLTLTSGTFDAVTYNVTTGVFDTVNSNVRTLRMGSGTWTISGTGVAWSATTTTNLTFFKGTANIAFSDTAITSREFRGGGLSYNKLTIGGATGTSTLTITGNNQFTELASTKTVAHTIALGTTTQTFGAWTVTGTAGNVVTLTGTGTAHILAGACTSGIDYLAMGSIGFAATSPGEFYAGANSTGTAAAPVYRTAKPADSTRYWVGGTGNWSDTARWSTSSGGGSGASVPRSHDDVVFDALSNATAYTVTVGTNAARCNTLSISGPLTGNLTFNSNTGIPLIAHGNVTFAATGVVSSSMTGGIVLSGSTTGKTFTTNGVALTSNTDVIRINGVGCGWSLGSAANLGINAGVNVVNGSFDTANYALTAAYLISDLSHTRSLSLGSSTITMTGFNNGIAFGVTENQRASFVFSAGTSQINTASVITFNGNNQTFYNFAFTTTSPTSISITGANTFNNLSFTGLTSAGLKNVSVSANQTINGTLTLSAGTNATMRTFMRSDTIGTTRTLTCAAFSGTDADFRDITIAGAAAPVSGTRLGDCKGNSGITFPAAKTVYFAVAAGSWNGGATWAATNGGTPDSTQFPLAQDIAVFPSSPTPYPSSGGNVNLNAAYNVGTIDMSARTSNTMTLSTSANTPLIYGNWINGTGTTLTGTGAMTFAGRGSQTITSAGRTFTQSTVIDSLGGSVTLQDAFITNRSASGALTVDRGTFDANGYNITLSGSGSSFNSSNTNTRTVAVGSGTWTIAGSATADLAWQALISTNLTVTGTGTISLTSASDKNFNGGGVSYSGITLNQGGAGTLTITGNNTFANISNTYKATGATTIALVTTTQRVGNFTASGEAGRVLTVQGASASSPATLVFTGSGQATTSTTDYLTVTGVRAYSLDTTWYAGANSTNNGSLGWYFEAGGGGPIAVFIVESATSADAQSNIATFNISMSETTTAADAAAAGFICLGTLSESATVSDAVEAFRAFLASVVESATSSELVSAALTLSATIAELTAGADQLAVQSILTAPVSELAAMSDSVSGGLFFLSNISETTTAQELAAAFLAFNRAILEAAAVQDSSAVAASTFGASSAETATPLDAVQGANTGSSSLSESVTASEAQAAQFTAATAVAEASTAQETAAAVQLFVTRVAETAIPADTTSVAPSTFGAIALAAAQAAESFSPAGSIYNAALPVEVASALVALRRSKVLAVNLADYTETGAGVTADTLQVELLNDNRTTALVSYNEIFAEVLSVPTAVKRT